MNKQIIVSILSLFLFAQSTYGEDGEITHVLQKAGADGQGVPK
jgi:hypothetical protein